MISKNSSKLISRYSVKDTGEMVIFGKRTVNRKDMGGKYQSIRWKDTFGFSIFWNLKILSELIWVQKILLVFEWKGFLPEP